MRLVMLGYYKDKEATGKVLNKGWYATGVLGMVDKDGFLTLTGRKKNLIILSNGENISPEELEKDKISEKSSLIADLGLNSLDVINVAVAF